MEGHEEKRLGTALNNQDICLSGQAEKPGPGDRLIAGDRTVLSG